MNENITKELIKKESHYIRDYIIGFSVLTIVLILLGLTIAALILHSSNDGFMLIGAVVVLAFVLAVLFPFAYFAGIKEIKIASRVRKALKNDDFEVELDHITSFRGSREHGGSTDYHYNLSKYTKRTKHSLSLGPGLHNGDEFYLVYFTGTNDLIAHIKQSEKDL